MAQTQSKRKRKEAARRAARQERQTELNKVRAEARDRLASSREKIEKLRLYRDIFKYGSLPLTLISSIVIICLLFWGPQDRIDEVTNFLEKFGIAKTLTFIIIILLFLIGIGKYLTNKTPSGSADSDIEV